MSGASRIKQKPARSQGRKINFDGLKLLPCFGRTFTLASTRFVQHQINSLKDTSPGEISIRLRVLFSIKKETKKNPTT